MENAKKNISLNITTNLLVVFLGGIIGVFMTPFFINNLGISNYSVIPLFSSIIVYISFFSSIISSSVGRFSSIYFNKNDSEGLNRTLSTAFYSMIFLSILFIFASIILSFFIDKIVTIPLEIITEAKFLLVLNVISISFVAISTPLLVSAFLTHRFYLTNFIKITNRLLQPLFIIFLFIFLSPSIFYVGVSNVIVNIIYLLFSFFIFKKIMPNVKISFRHFNLSCFRDMVTMGTWNLINSLGALLFTSIDLILISHYLGSEACGKYAPLVQIMMLYVLVVDALCDVLTPVIFEYVSKENYSLVLTQARRATKYIGIFMIIPVSVLCVFSSEFLVLWLGKEFEEIWPVLILLLAPVILIHPIRPVMAISKAVNKVKLPAIVTVICGFINLILSIFFLKYTSLGLFGVGLATIISLILKNIIFNAAYCAHIIGKPWYSFYSCIFQVICLFVAAIIFYYFNRIVLIEYSFFMGSLLFILISIFYVYFVIRFIFDNNDRIFFKHTILRLG